MQNYASPVCLPPLEQPPPPYICIHTSSDVRRTFRSCSNLRDSLSNALFEANPTPRVPNLRNYLANAHPMHPRSQSWLRSCFSGKLAPEASVSDLLNRWWLGPEDIYIKSLFREVFRTFMMRWQARDYTSKYSIRHNIESSSWKMEEAQFARKTVSPKISFLMNPKSLLGPKIPSRQLKLET